ncbi:hypothetical protein MNBD_DELTA01-1311 [hydrothermal vent metagenome]|uniref:VanZ-like domain-containing protein n=1 Tax=hydrothermal vent metagenome TaxID=652676 RepID=A0A3B0RP83_9ZZZZ
MNNTAGSKPLLLNFFILLSYMALIFVLSVKPAPEGIPGFWQMDKLIHAGVYAVMGLLALGVTGRLVVTNKRRAALYAFLISFIFGGSMEVVQSFIPAREGSFYDCIANGIGAFIGVYIAVGIISRVCGRRQFSSGS